MSISPFEMELASIVGWFDGTSVNLNTGSTRDLAVILHEGVHNDIFRTTPDGNLLKTAVWASNNFSDDDQKQDVTYILSRNFAHNRVAHEAAATYIGIKLLLTEGERFSACAALPAEYKEYYAHYEGMIGAVSPSTFMQVVFAKAVYKAIFSSVAYKAFIKGKFDFSVLGQKEFQAVYRQTAVKSWLTNGGVELSRQFVKDIVSRNDEFAPYLASGDRVSFFGLLDSDDTWGLDLSKFERLDFLLIPALYEFVLARVPLESLSTGSSEYVDLLHQTSPFFAQFGTEQLFTSTYVPGRQSAIPKVHGLLNDFLSAATTRCLTNADTKYLKAKPVDLSGEEYVFHDRQIALNLIFDGEEITQSAVFEVVGARPTAGAEEDYFETVDVVPCTSAMAAATLRCLATDRANKCAATALGVVVVPFTGLNKDSEDQRFAASIYSAGLSQSDSNFELVESPGVLINETEFFTYVVDDWPILCGDKQQTFEFLNSVHITGLEMDDITLNIAKLTGHFGFFIKACPGVLSRSITEFHELLKENGRVLPLEEGAFEGVIPRAALALQVCMRYWPAV